MNAENLPAEQIALTEAPMASAAQTFASIKDTQLALKRLRALKRLKALLFAVGRLALTSRMNAAQAEIERGKERLWLKRDGE